MEVQEVELPKEKVKVSPCPTCGNDHIAKPRFCPVCGVELPKRLYAGRPMEYCGARHRNTAARRRQRGVIGLPKADFWEDGKVPPKR